jgi:hypothetical protein
MGREPFEAPWMTDYIDRQLRVDSSRTQAELDWSPTARLEIRRRLLLLVENMKSHGEVWLQRNEEALHRVARRPNLVIADALDESREQLVDRILDEITGPQHGERFRRYRDMEPETLRWFLMLLFQVLLTSARLRDKRLMRQYAHMIALRRHGEGVAAERVKDVLTLAGRIITAELQKRPALADLGQHIHDNVSLSIQLACDAVDDAYETIEGQALDADERLEGFEMPANAGDLQHMVSQIRDICEDTLPARMWSIK